MTVQFVEIAGQKMAMLPVAEFERLVDLAEDKLDVSAAIVAERRRTVGEDYVPVEIVDRLIAGENALKVWRKHRGLTQMQLAAAAGISQAFVGFLEKGQKNASPKKWHALAKVLNVSREDIEPPVE